MIPPIASRFVAGETEREALDHVRGLNRNGIGGILNLLGEHYKEPQKAVQEASHYLTLLDAIADSTVDASISVKPSQLGLEIDTETFHNQLERIIKQASEQNIRVWVDMEEYTSVGPTIETVQTLAGEYPADLGVCLQANLRRTQSDLETLADTPIAVRLVKGAYDEPPEVAFQDSDTVDAMYKEGLAYLFAHFEDGIGVGSHDPEMIEYAHQLHEDHGTPYEIQMLMGVRSDAQRALAADGVTVNQYVPYGSQWFSYFYRRVRERKENLMFALRAVADQAT